MRFRTAARVRDDWGAETFAVKLQVDPDRANLAGITNQDVSAILRRRPERYAASPTLRDGRRRRSRS